MLVALQGESIWKGEEEVEGTVRQVFIIDRRSRLRIEVKGGPVYPAVVG